MKITFSAPKPEAAGALVVGVLEKGRLTPSATALDEASGGALAKAIKGAPRFTGKLEQIQNMPAPTSLKADTVILVGLGNGKGIDAQKAQRLGGVIAAKLLALGVKEATVDLNGMESDSAEFAANLAAGMRLRSYRFDKYRTKQKAEDKPALKKLTVATPDQKGAKKLFGDLDRVVDGVFLTRDLVSEPPNVLFPDSFAERARELEKLGVEIEVLDAKQMKKLGMGALLGVGQGSQHESRLVVMQWKGGRKADAPVAFVGKGVTFDTGGISLKPGQGMWDMKWDMGGAGVVTGLMAALAGRKAKTNAVGVIGLVENMPDGNAQRPGDIVTSMSGQTIEVWNTDAEGRLVLADALWYTVDRFKPKAMVDLATLTGAIIIALGEVTAGMFANDDALSEQLSAAGKAVGEPVWRFPLADEYDRMIDSDVADMKNIAGSRSAGSIVAAQFLQRFVTNTKWAHLDIAGVTWSAKTTPLTPKGGTGFGVRLLDRWVAEVHEK
ncbi:MAG: leucyl aminopeptidase [Azospirillaceae bacterium]